MFKNIIKAMISARQSKADEHVARYLQKEYAYESYDYLLSMVKQGKINEILK